MCCVTIFLFNKLNRFIEEKNLDLILLQGTQANADLLKSNNISALRPEYLNNSICIYGKKFSNRVLDAKFYLEDALNDSNSILVKLGNQFFAAQKLKDGKFWFFNSHGDAKEEPASLVTCESLDDLKRHITKKHLLNSLCRSDVSFIPMINIPVDNENINLYPSGVNETFFTKEASKFSSPEYKPQSSDIVNTPIAVSIHDCAPIFYLYRTLL